MSTENKKHWYTLHVYSSMEKSVKHALEERIAQSGPLREKFGAVLLPIEKVHEIRNGRKMTSERRMYPGYVFIEMEMNEATWHLVNSTPRVIEFLGNNNPVMLSDAEVANILNAAEMSAEKPRPKIEFEIGEMIRVKTGAFKDFTGRWLMSLHSHKDVRGRYIRVPQLFEVDLSGDKLVVKSHITGKADAARR